MDQNFAQQQSQAPPILVKKWVNKNYSPDIEDEFNEKAIFFCHCKSIINSELIMAEIEPLKLLEKSYINVVFMFTPYSVLGYDDIRSIKTDYFLTVDHFNETKRLFKIYETPHCFLLSSSGNILWNGNHEALKNIDEKLFAEKNLMDGTSKKIVTTFPNNDGEKYEEEFSYEFSLKFFEERQNIKPYRFNTIGGFKIVDKLTNIFKHLLGVNTCRINVIDVPFDPMLEMESYGLISDTTGLLSFLEKTFGVMVKKEMIEKEVWVINFTKLNKLNQAQIVSGKSAVLDSSKKNWEMRNFTFQELSNLLEEWTSEIILFDEKNIYPDYGFDWIIPAKLNFKDLAQLLKNEYGILFLKEKRNILIYQISSY